jgi:hypothetical protein
MQDVLFSAMQDAPNDKSDLCQTRARHPEFDEKWLQKCIDAEPTILGLGDVIVIDRERRQERAGRLDLLLADPDQNRRYEVELMLGSTDESHIIRCIEYWDIERRRYPSYEHCAVLIAEDITSRFLNVVALLAGTIPLVAIQINALVIGDKMVIDFVRVLDQRLLRRDDVDGNGPLTDRAWWVDKSSAPIMQIVGDMLTIINEKADPKQQLNFNKYYIGLTDGLRSRNFIYFRPRKKFVRVTVPGEWTEDRSARFKEADVDAEQSDDKLVFNLTPTDLTKHRDLIEWLRKTHDRQEA